MLGLLCCTGFSLVVKPGDHSLVAMGGLLIAVASLVAELRLQAHGLNSCGLRALHCRLSSVVQGLSCCAACGIFLDQGSNPCPLHWQADSYHCVTKEVQQLTFLAASVRVSQDIPTSFAHQLVLFFLILWQCWAKKSLIVFLLTSVF